MSVGGDVSRLTLWSSRESVAEGVFEGGGWVVGGSLDDDNVLESCDGIRVLCDGEADDDELVRSLLLLLFFFRELG